MPVELIGILPWNDGTHTSDLSQDFGSGSRSRLVGFDTGLRFCSGTGLLSIQVPAYSPFITTSGEFTQIFVILKFLNYGVRCSNS